MFTKKFVPPLLKNRPQTDESGEPPQKKAKLEAPEGPATQIRRFSQPPFRKPLLSVKNESPKNDTPEALSPPAPSSNPTASVKSERDLDTSGCYNVLWRKFTTKKHKTFDDDGILIVKGGYAILQDKSGKELSRGFFNRKCEIGETIPVGNREVEINSILDKKEYDSGRVFLPASKETLPILKSAVPFAKKAFKAPLLKKTTPRPPPTVEPKPVAPKHRTDNPDAFVLPRPPPGYTKRAIVDVVVDPTLGRHLRPHQKEGIKFMYECVMGFKDHSGEGCILADEMGLGKTLQTIALLWTLQKQNPEAGRGPVVKRALIICPVTLTSNWKKEFKKWLGEERIRVFIIDGNKTTVRDFAVMSEQVTKVMIIGYERFQKEIDKVQKIGFDIVIADEGHRLKGEKNKAAQAIQSLSTNRRVILSGTPLQNDLHEFFVMVDFVNPGVLSTYKTFKREFEDPIVRSRQPGASDAAKEKGEARSEELARLTSQFILRRTADILSKYLPPKSEWVLMCKPTPIQIELYGIILKSAQAVALGSPQASFQLINVLKKLCNSPALLSTTSNEEDGDFGASLTSQQLKATPIKSSGKLSFLDRFLFTLYNMTDEKVVLVSNYTATLDLLANLLGARKYSHLRLDGNTPPAKRQQLVDQFNRTSKEESFAFLLSAKAGGVGLNLIGASRLVLVDSDWNPAVDAQAMARVHRDGQKRPVSIYRLLTSGCMDERIYQRQLTKQGLADSIVDQKATAQSFSQSELKDLFSLDASLALSSETCLTHNLMACNCDCIGEVPESKTPSSATENNSDAGDDDEEELPDITKLIKASQLESEVIKRLQEDELAKRRGGKLGALKGWGHIKGQAARKKKEESDPEPVILEDDVLQKVVGHSDAVGFMFFKRSS